MRGEVGRKGRREVKFGGEVEDRVRGRKNAGMKENCSVRKILQ